MSSAEMAEEENERPSTMQRGRASSRDQSGSSDRTSEGGRTTELPTATRRFESLDDRMRKADRPSKKVKEKKTGPWYRRLLDKMRNLGRSSSPPNPEPLIGGFIGPSMRGGGGKSKTNALGI